MRVEAPAKVNLFLRVLAREEGGRHQVETAYAALGIADDVTVERASGGIELTVRGAELGPTEENLAHRAARAFLQRTGGGGARIVLEKRIPPRGGLGGGSSDAAAVLRSLNRLHGDALTPGELVTLGARLGADVPFFLSPTALALGWGRGDRLLSLPPLPARPVLLILPDEGVGTAEAYAKVAEARRERDAGWAGGRLLPLEVLGSWEGVAGLAENEFHDTVFRDRPDLARARATLLETRPVLALLCGSGATLFAVYADMESAREARDAVAERLPDARTLLTTTLERLPPVTPLA